ncbi:hypothetical protein E2C01_085746 [Portunus trituberculatus]|uniref:Uncharacterized protein n=1 Tax=Portunus trituberculatus TaxID=210409 RepID=A0A5B7JCR8_PORTR|nr:hypothetical protein [Portunus trituberculatus]
MAFVCPALLIPSCPASPPVTAPYSSRETR